MTTKYEVRYACDPKDFKAYDTERIRSDFLISDIMVPDKVCLCYTHYDRFIAGSAIPVDGSLTLETIDPLKSEYFLERRELGVINVGGTGIIEVDQNTFTIECKEALYVGRGSKRVVFKSANSDNPAKFYLNSAPAHHMFPTVKISSGDAVVVEAGSASTSNARTIRKLVESSVVDVCQVQMGITELHEGSSWNTMPCHTHDRRMEVYFYFNLPEGEAVCHFMGEPDETRHIWVHNEQAVISPPWSIHTGSGTGQYAFIWGMAGENLDYSDMDTVSPVQLK